MDIFTIIISIVNIIFSIANIAISSYNARKANDISEKQLMESRKPDVARNVQLSSISRSIQRLDTTLSAFLTDRRK